MNVSIKKSVFGIIVIFITSCSTISYVPNISLDISPKTINKSVQIEKFVDLSPLSDTKNPIGGFSVTNPEALSNMLDVEVTNAVVADLSTSGLFKQVSRKIDNPDYILKGEIIKYAGKSELNDFTKITLGIAVASMIMLSATNNNNYILGVLPAYSYYFGVPFTKHTAKIEIIMKLYDKNNILIGTYTGKASDRNSSNLYHNKSLAVSRLTNKTFSSVIMQIREQILKDIKILEK
jgi:hypothetical protein